MTGEITLTGQVLPIGGLREKSLAAQRAGLKRVVFPRENEPDLDELPAETREALEFIPADTIEDVFAAAFDGKRAQSGGAALRRPRSSLRARRRRRCVGRADEQELALAAQQEGVAVGPVAERDLVGVRTWRRRRSPRCARSRSRRPACATSAIRIASSDCTLAKSAAVYGCTSGNVATCTNDAPVPRRRTAVRDGDLPAGRGTEVDALAAHRLPLTVRLAARLRSLRG